MNSEPYAELLQRFDDPEYFEWPSGFDYADAVFRFREFVQELEVKLNLTLKADSSAQDSSFHSEVLLPGGFLRFSNFGDMVATTDDDEFDPEHLQFIRELLAQHGYRFIPHEVLESDYTGRHPAKGAIRDWWIRYFDYG